MNTKIADDTLWAETTSTYLGDGVHVTPWPEVRGIKLTTQNGLSTTNTIYLNHEVLEALKDYIKKGWYPFDSP
jgi:hypothetical protein